MSRTLILALAAFGGLMVLTMRTRFTDCSAAPTAETGQDDSAAVRRLVTLVRSPRIQAELKLDASQTTAVEKAVAEIDQPLWRLRDAKDRQSAERIRALRSRFDSDLSAVLRPQQQRRLEQLRWR